RSHLDGAFLSVTQTKQFLLQHFQNLNSSWGYSSLSDTNMLPLVQPKHRKQQWASSFRAVPIKDRVPPCNTTRATAQADKRSSTTARHPPGLERPPRPRAK